MSATTTSALISASAALGGAIVGGLMAIGQASWQERRAQGTKRDEERRQLQRQAARRCDELFRQLAVDLPITFRTRMATEESTQRRDRTASAYDEIETVAIDLPVNIRRRVEEALQSIRWADRLAEFHYDSPGTIAKRIEDDVHAALAAFLRNESDIPSKSERMVEYDAAYDDLRELLDDEFAQEIAESRDAREAWLKQHPDAKARLAHGRTSTESPER